MPGPFFFKWLPASVPFDEHEHAVTDEDIFELEISQQEGEFATLRIDVKNPKIGLLGPGRNTWAWLSWDTGSSPPIKPLFHGRLIAIPEQLSAEIVRLQFVARPTDYNEQREAIAEHLREPPFWDMAFINPDQWHDLDVVLEARTELWHIDRLTHNVSVSNIITGEDETLIFSADQHFYDGLSVSYSEPPLRKVHVEAEAQWSQFGSGRIDISDELSRAFLLAGAPHYPLIASFSGGGLLKDWPKVEKRIGGGWKVGVSEIERVDSLWFQTRYQRHNFNSPVVEDNTGLGLGNAQFSAWFPLWEFSINFQVDYEGTRKRSDILTFDLEADVQSILTEPHDQAVLNLTPKSNDLATDHNFTGLSGQGEIPIVDPGRRAYFITDRGRQSIDYLVALARSRLLIRARAVELSFNVKWELGLDVTLRMNAEVHDNRLPGVVASGKIISYSLRASGNGELSATLTIGCMIGYGDIVVPREGEPLYVELDYVEDYQVYIDQDSSPIGYELAYYIPTIDIQDDGLDLTQMNAKTVIRDLTIIGGPDEQRYHLSYLGPFDDGGQVLEQAFTEVRLELVPVTGEAIVNNYTLELSHLMVPQTINLEAPFYLLFEATLAATENQDTAVFDGTIEITNYRITTAGDRRVTTTGDGRLYIQ